MAKNYHERLQARHLHIAFKGGYLNIEFNRGGLRKNEGLNVYIDAPVIFYKGYDLHKTELDYSDKELADAFRLPINVIETFCDSASNNGKLKLII